jgi:DNA-binding transcriptional LysR family regulator
MQLDAEHTLAELEGIKSGTGGTLRIGASPVWLRVYLPPLIERMQREFANLRVELVAGTTDTLLPALLHGKIDVFCADLNFPAHPELHSLHLADLDFAVIAGKSHPLARKDKVQAADLLQYPWITLLGNYSGTTRLGSFFAAQNLAPPVSRVVVSPGVGNFGFLTAGSYLTYIPTDMLELAERYDCVPLPLTTKFWQTAVGLVHRNGHSPEAAVSAFISTVREHFGK